jgi:hypothetical protein
MRKITKITALTVILGSSIFAQADDYALVDNYKLLNDMKLAQKQQELIVNIGQKLDEKNIDIDYIKMYQNRFSRVLSGLLNGDKSLKINGTDLPKLQAKINELKKLWKKESKLISKALKNRDKKYEAIVGLNHIMLKSTELIELYNKSYSRFKQKSKLSSIVYQHEVVNQRSRIAFNINY